MIINDIIFAFFCNKLAIYIIRHNNMYIPISTAILPLFNPPSSRTTKNNTTTFFIFLWQQFILYAIKIIDNIFFNFLSHNKILLIIKQTLKNFHIMRFLLF